MVVLHVSRNLRTSSQVRGLTIARLLERGHVATYSHVYHFSFCVLGKRCRAFSMWYEMNSGCCLETTDVVCDSFLEAIKECKQCEVEIPTKAPTPVVPPTPDGCTCDICEGGRVEDPNREVTISLPEGGMATATCGQWALLGCSIVEDDLCSAYQDVLNTACCIPIAPPNFTPTPTPVTPTPTPLPTPVPPLPTPKPTPVPVTPLVRFKIAFRVTLGIYLSILRNVVLVSHFAFMFSRPLCLLCQLPSRPRCLLHHW